MSKYSEIASRFNRMAKENINKYKAAKNKLDEAKNNLDARKLNGTDAEKAVASANYQLALEEHRTAEREFRNSVYSFNGMDKEFAIAVSEEYGARPEHIDDKIMQLLNSNIMTATEYDRLLNQQIVKGNVTMARIIAGAAKKRSDETEDRNEKALLYAVSQNAPADYGNEKNKLFEALQFTYNRCIANPLLADKWDELTTPIIEKI